MSRGRKPPSPEGSGGVGPSALLRTLNDEHRITSAHDALHMDPRRSELSPREFHHGLLEEPWKFIPRQRELPGRKGDGSLSEGSTPLSGSDTLFEPQRYSNRSRNKPTINPRDRIDAHCR